MSRYLETGDTRMSINSAAPDERELRRLHEVVLEAHLKSDVELLLRDEDDDYSIANRGSITHPTREERRQRLGPYLAATRFSVYRDLVPPVVRTNGSLGWVIAQVKAQGEQRTSGGEMESLEFVSAWIELYEKRRGRWVRIGNVSNFQVRE